MADVGRGAGADTGTDMDIQLLRRPETLTQLCDIVTHPYDGPLDYDYIRLAEAAATRGRGISPELWAAGIWAIAHIGYLFYQIEVLTKIVPEVHAYVCGDYSCPTEHQIKEPEWELAKIAYMICPKESPVFPLILYSLARSMPWALGQPVVVIRASPGGEAVTTNRRDLLAAVLSHPTAPARLRASVLCDQAWAQGVPASIELLYQAHETDPTCVTVYTYLSYYTDTGGARTIRLGSRMLNLWGLALEAVANVVGGRHTIYYTLLSGNVPELDGTTISLGDSSMPIFDYICALETPAGSAFCPAMLTDMLPADTPWTCRRHEALDRHTGANALFATFLCALARLEGPGGPLRPSHQTVWEHALESWTLGDSARIYKA